MALPRAIWGQNVPDTQCGYCLEGEGDVALGISNARVAAMLEEASGPAEPALGISDKRPDNTLASFPPNT